MILVHFSFAEKKSGQKRKPVGGCPRHPRRAEWLAMLATSFLGLVFAQPSSNRQRGQGATIEYSLKSIAYKASIALATTQNK